MDRNYLVTYNYTDSEGFGANGYEWFETYEDLIEHVDNTKLNGRKWGISDFEVIEIIKINSCEILYDCDDGEEDI